MTRWFGAVSAAVAVAVLVLTTSGTAQDKGPTAKDVMKAVAGKTGLCAKCVAAGKEGNWDEAQKLARALNECGTAMTKCPCPRGDAASWAKLSKEFGANTAAIQKAADSKDKDAFEKAVKTFTSACSTCHAGHKASKK